MDLFEYRAGALHCEGVPAADLVQEFGTPTYVYSAGTLREHVRRMQAAFAELHPLICFSVKSCQNLHILRLLRELGCGFDVVSGGELRRALRIGADPASIVYAGVGKTETEIREALAAGIRVFNVESESELAATIELAAQVGVKPTMALRVNPDVDPHTHEYTTTGKKETKFGVDIDRAADVYRRFAGSPHVRLSGIHLHIGSPVNDVGAYRDSVTRAMALVDQLRGEGFEVDTFDVGGGFGAHYQGGEAPPAADYAAAIVPLLRGRGLRTILEPGRSIAANAGVLLTRVLHIKESGARRFVIVDASMTDLIRPALYGAYHFIWPVDAIGFVPVARGRDQPHPGLSRCDVVGPVCESGDFLGKDRLLPPLRRGDLLAVFTVGAYGIVMASQYNSRPRGPEILVDGTTSRLIRRRETFDDLIAPEMI